MKSPSSHNLEHRQINTLMSIADAAALIRAGAPLSIAGRPAALDQLPTGNWIGGTTPYFMTEDGGTVIGDDRVFVTDFSAAPHVSVAAYGADALERISGEAPDNGFALAILPAESECHRRFATEAASYPQAFLRPTVGWIAGFDLNEPGAHASVYDGRTGIASRDLAVVLHVSLPADELVSVEIVNLFTPDDGDVIHFAEASFAPEACEVNGVRTNFADYVAARGRADGRLPLIGDFGGAHVNASIRAIDAASRTVTLYAPVFPGVDYRFAAPVADYAGSFRDALAARPAEGTLWSCNCILNFLFGELAGKAIGGTAGPITFGEIAYQLLNQTLVRVRGL